MYQMVYDLCNAYPKDFTEQLFLDIGHVIKEHVVSVLNKLIALITQQLDDIEVARSIVEPYSSEWQKYNESCDYINKVCKFINVEIFHDKHSIARLGLDDLVASTSSGEANAHRLTSVEGLAYFIWKERILSSLKLEHGNALIKSLLVLFHSTRSTVLKDDGTINIELCKVSLNSFVTLNKYSSTETPKSEYLEEFETECLKQTCDHFTNDSSLKLQESSNTGGFSGYMKYVYNVLQEEAGRFKEVFSLKTQRGSASGCIEKVMKNLDIILIDSHLQIYQKEFMSYLKAENRECLRLSYELVKRLRDGLSPVVLKFEEIMSEEGKRFVEGIIASRNSINSVAYMVEYVDKLVGLHTKFSSLITTCFDDEILFETSRDKAMRCLVNSSFSGKVNSSELLSKNSDYIMKKSLKSVADSQAEFDETLEKIMVIFKYLDDKDLFLEFYSRQFARRLISGSYVLANEEAFIQKLRQTVGQEFVSKFQRMLTDVSLSADLTAEFEKEYEQNTFNTLVLTAGSWPLSTESASKDQLILDGCLENSLQSFVKFYNAKKSGRVIKWMYSLFRCVVKFKSKGQGWGYDKPYEVNMSLWQYMVLSQFNDTDINDKGKISRNTGLGVIEVEKALNVFVESQILKKGDEIATYILNKEFSHGRIRMKLASSSQESASTSEDTTVKKSVEEDRKLLIQAAIVRLMKSKKEMAHNFLVQEIIATCKDRFAPSISMIKKCIEILIEKGYMERDHATPSKTSSGSIGNEKYVYIA